MIAATDGAARLHMKSKSSMPCTARSCMPYTTHRVRGVNSGSPGAGCSAATDAVVVRSLDTAESALPGGAPSASSSSGATNFTPTGSDLDSVAAAPAPAPSSSSPPWSAFDARRISGAASRSPSAMGTMATISVSGPYTRTGTPIVRPTWRISCRPSW